MSSPAAGRWWRFFKTVCRATVVEVDLSRSPARESAAYARLDEQDRDRCRRFAIEGPRRRFVMSRAALRAILCDHLGCRNGQISFEATEHGKPFALVDGTLAPISFSVSHSGEHGLIALAPTGRLGVDVEERVARRDLDLLADTVLGERERAELSSKRGYEKLHLFFKLWTIKEALIKAHGMGFLLDVSGFEVPSPMLRGVARGKLRLPQQPEVEWQVEDLGTERFAAAIAYEVDGTR